MPKRNIDEIHESIERMKNTRQLLAAFRKAGLTPKIGDGWLNISRPDGVHCEFYPCGNNELFTATYTINGKETELDFWIPDDIDDFVFTVCEILEYKPKKKRA